jgi:hypothetical protein
VSAAEYFNEASREYLKWVMGISDGVDPSCERYLLKMCAKTHLSYLSHLLLARRIN